MTRAVLHGGSVFDGSGTAPAVADVVMEDGRIVDVGPGLDGDEVVDCSGQAVLPGFIDSHVHFLINGQLDPMYSVRRPFSLAFFEAAENMRATLDVGITTVREAGGSDLGIKTAQQRGMIAGPRMQISISMLSQTGGHGDDWQVCGAHMPAFFVAHPGHPDSIVDGPDEMRRKVRELVRAGADVIKVATSGGVLSPRDDPRHGHFRDAELAVLVEEATGGGPVRDGPRPGDRRDQGRDPQRDPLDRARHLPRRRGDRADARARHVPGADADRAARGARGRRGRRARPARGGREDEDGDGGALRVGEQGDRRRREGGDGHRQRRDARTARTCASCR